MNPSEQFLHDGWHALENGDSKIAESHAQAALAQEPSPEGFLLLSQVHLEREESTKALDVLERAISEFPDEPELLLGAADAVLAVENPELEQLESALEWCARGRKLTRDESEGSIAFDFFFIEGSILNQLGQPREALAALERALKIDPNAPGALFERGVSLFELCRFDEAHKVFAALPLDEPSVQFHLGLVAEHRGDFALADTHFARADSTPLKLDPEAFDDAVRSAVEMLPAEVKPYLANTNIRVKPLPSLDELADSDPPLSPQSLGMFRGTPIGERSVSRAEDHSPATIVLYQRNLERFARTRDELLEEIAITLQHEVGHLLGLDEDDLAERGLD